MPAARQDGCREQDGQRQGEQLLGTHRIGSFEASAVFGVDVGQPETDGHSCPDAVQPGAVEAHSVGTGLSAAAALLSLTSLALGGLRLPMTLAPVSAA